MVKQSSLGFTIACLLAATLFTSLGVWQVSRLRERRAINASLLAGRSLPVVELQESLPTGEAGAGGLVNRRVEATGEYDSGNEFVLRLRTYEGVPGVWVVTPLRPGLGDSAVLVLRGFVPAPDGMQANLDGLSEPGSRTVTGIALGIGVMPDSGQLVKRKGMETWRGLDLSAVRERLPYPVRDFFILQTPDSALPRFPRRLEAPGLDEGSHFSYAIQWFSLALIVGAGGIIVRRKQSAPDQGVAGG
jgi:surfeit locus 1 family protein